MSQPEKVKSLLRDMEAYKPYFDWELKTGELTTPQRRIVRAMRFGCYGEKKCYLTQRPIVPQLLHDAYDVHHLVKRGSPGCLVCVCRGGEEMMGTLKAEDAWIHKGFIYCESHKPKYARKFKPASFPIPKKNDQEGPL